MPELPCVSVFVVGGAPGLAEGSPDRTDEVVATPGSVPDPTGTAGAGALAPHAAKPSTTPITMVRWMRKTNDPSPRTGATVRFVTQLPAVQHVQTEPCPASRNDAAAGCRTVPAPKRAAEIGIVLTCFDDDEILLDRAHLPAGPGQLVKAADGFALDGGLRSIGHGEAERSTPCGARRGTCLMRVRRRH